MRRSIKKVAAGLLATMMIGTMLTGCGGGNKKDSDSSKKETSEINTLCDKFSDRFCLIFLFLLSICK